MVSVQYISNDWIMNFGMVLFFMVFLMLLIILIVFIRTLFLKKKIFDFNPKITVLIPAYNEERVIKKTIHSLLNSNYEFDKLEVLIVDDGSTDNTIEAVKSFVSKYDNIKILKGSHVGKSESLNLGVKYASHDFILTLDADTVIDKDFIKEVVSPFKDERVGATNGIAHISDPKRIIEHFQNVEYCLNNLIRNSFSKIFNNGIWFFGAAACFRKEALKKSGHFSKDILTEDMDISLKIFEHSYDVLTIQKAIYHTRPSSSIRELFIQRMRWFYGGLQCMKKHKRLLRRKSFAIKYLFFNQIFWATFSILVIPIIIYQVFYWFPTGLFEIIAYLFRWFSFTGPIYVLYKIPVWGLSFINLFGVLSGVITSFLLVSSIVQFKEKINLTSLLVIFFYFPYTLVLNAILGSAILKYRFSKKKHFIK